MTRHDENLLETPPKCRHQVFGLDLAGPGNETDTAAVLCRGVSAGLVLESAVTGLDDEAILALLPSGGELVVGMDAPLSYQPGGGDRPGDRELRGVLRAHGLSSGTVMPPTMTRMAYLTLRGMAVARSIACVSPGARIAEVHPAGAMVLRGAPAADVRSLKTSATARNRLAAFLKQLGLVGDLPPDPSDHILAAAAAALAAWNWSQGRTVWRMAAAPPLHPFDYVC